MGLKKCKTCGGDVASECATCPHCGAILKKKTSGCMLLAILVIIAMVVYKVNLPEKTEQDRKNEQKQQEARENYRISIIQKQKDFLAGFDYYSGVEIYKDEIYVRKSSNKNIIEVISPLHTAAFMASKELENAHQISQVMIWLISDTEPIPAKKAFYWVLANHGKIIDNSSKHKK